MTEPLLVGGRPAGGQGEPMPVENPATGEVLAVVATASAADVDAAVRAGAEAAADPAWRGMLPHERARLLHRSADLILARHEELARLQTDDNGKPIAETRALVASAAGTFRYYAAAVETLDDDLTTPRGPYISMSVHEPLGVVGAISPWNSPIASEAQKAAPALAAGNAVVLKPAEWSPLLALRLGEILLEAGFPPGLVSVLPGPGAVTGEAIVRHPLVRKVSFTGGTVTGRRIAEAAAAKLMPVSLELGGKSPTIVLDDAEIDLAVRGVAYGIFSSEGQSCIAGSRLFVPWALHDEFVERLCEVAAGLVVGDPHDEATHMGPLVSSEHRDKVRRHVDGAVAEGGKVVTGGGPPAGLGSGYYFEPTIVTGLLNGSALCQQEVFGPVLAVLGYDDDADLVRQANDTVYGLACGIWTRDYRRAWNLARRVEAGTVWINTYKQFSISTPFGGQKESGTGREKGRDGIRAYQAQKSVYWGLDERPMRWGSPAAAGSAPPVDVTGPQRA